MNVEFFGTILENLITSASAAFGMNVAIFKKADRLSDDEFSDRVMAISEANDSLVKHHPHKLDLWLLPCICGGFGYKPEMGYWKKTLSSHLFSVPCPPHESLQHARFPYPRISFPRKESFLFRHPVFQVIFKTLIQTR